MLNQQKNTDNRLKLPCHLMILPDSHHVLD